MDLKDSRGYHGCKRPRSALPPAPGRLHACRRTGRVPPPGPGERKSPAFRRRGSGSAGAQGPESDRAAPSRRRRPHRRGTRRERRLLPRRAGARTRGLFKSRGRAGPDRARRQGAAAACAGLGLLRHRGALSPAQLRPRPPAVRTSPLGSARLCTASPAQPPRDPPSLRAWGHAGAPCPAAEASRDLARRPAAARLRRWEGAGGGSAWLGTAGAARPVAPRTGSRCPPSEKCRGAAFSFPAAPAGLGAAWLPRPRDVPAPAALPDFLGIRSSCGGALRSEKRGGLVKKKKALRWITAARRLERASCLTEA